MRRLRLRSLQARLALRLAVTFLVASAIAICVLIYRAYDTADTLNDRELSLRAADLAGHVAADTAGRPLLRLSSSLTAAYAAAGDEDVYAIRASDGHLIAASPERFGGLVAAWPPPTGDPSFFRLGDIGTSRRDYYGLSVALDSAAGPVWIAVARAAGGNALVEALLQDFVVDIAWLIPVLVAVTLGIAVLAIRSGLKPVERASHLAATIGPNAISRRLPESDVPSEVAPLVAAVNRALDRLEQGFVMQRQFTANAAHELRTPLAIVSAAMEAMDQTDELVQLRGDVARMNRLVEQLLRVSRLDAIALDVSGCVDLNEVAHSIVAAIAPFAIAQRRTVGLSGGDRAVYVKGNADAIADALRNLVENAISHSPPGEEVGIVVSRDGSVAVIDRGLGIAPADRERIFDRFWRSRDARTGGAGLGLAIVNEIMRAHGGSVAVGDNPGGGAVFTLSFPLASERDLIASSFGGAERARR
jgi:two-component system, OmpR family, sensor histidine kinase TctE